MPHSVFQNTLLQGKESIIHFLEEMLSLMPEYKFISFKLYIDTPQQAFAEYEVDTLFKGKPYRQLYMGRLVARDGKIKLLREACDTVQIANIK